MGRRRAVSKGEGEGAGTKRRRMSAPNPKKKGDVKDIKGESSGGVNAVQISMPEAPASSGDGIVHPLLIPHILDKVFQHIIRPKTDDEESYASVISNVKNLRLVCKQWKDNATRLYRRNRAPMMSFGLDPPPKYPDEKMQNFLEVMRSSDLIPFQRYRISTFFFVKKNEQLMKDFMSICGPSAVELDLHSNNDRTMKFSRRDFPDLNLMSLKTLEFECEEDKHAVRSPNEIAYLLEVLLNAAKTLQNFDYSSLGLGLDGEWSQAMIQRFGDCISKRLPTTVKMLCLDIPLIDSHLSTLTERDLKLREFHFDAQSGASSMAIRKFLEKQAATLEYLRVLFCEDVSNLPSVLDFPRFDELRYLELHGGKFQEFSFPDTFPKLTTLNLWAWKTQSTCVELLSSAKKGLSLKEIHFPEALPYPQATLVNKVGQSFPNIRTLHISPSSEDISETLEKVFVWYPNVEELTVEFPHTDEVSIDSILSGVPEHDCQRITKDHRNFYNVNLENVQQQPSLLNLTKLKKLVFADCCGCNVILTDFAAHFVFLKMDSLKELRTRRFQMSTKYLNLLREKLTLKITT